MPLSELNRKPPHLTDDRQFATWFAAIADQLLNRADFLVAGEPYRFAELEAYYFGPAHPDPFTHRDPVQYQNGRWYFHRTGGEYRGGTYKGVDLTFGDGTAMLGVLVRSVVAPSGALIDGPSLTVDHLLARTGTDSPAGLDAVIAGRRIWDTTSPLAIRESESPRAAAVYHTARVGLTLKRARGKPDAPKYVMKPYRYLTEPRRIKKGMPQLVVALHQRGEDAATIRDLTGVPKAAVGRYVADFEAGKAVPDFTRYVGKDLSTPELCKLMGTWTAKYGQGGE